MAWIVERSSGFLVRWRDAKTQSVFSQMFETREQAEAFRRMQWAKERRATQALRRMVQRDVRQGEPVQNLFGGLDEFLGTKSLYPGEGFAAYGSRIIEDDDGLKLSSKRTYGHVIKNHIWPSTLGRTPVEYIRPNDIEEFWNKLKKERKLGTAALRNVGQVLRKGFRAAVRRGLIEVNPMSRADIKVPSKSDRVRSEPEPLTVDEVERLAAGADRDRDRLVILMMSYCGLRAGEIGGLRRQDIRGGRLYLQQQVVRAGSEKMISTLKTKAARRQVGVPATVWTELQRYLATSTPAVSTSVQPSRAHWRTSVCA
jgi:integrase